MQYHCNLVSDERWGIYKESDLLATIGGQQACQAVIEALEESQAKKQVLREHLGRRQSKQIKAA